MLYNKNSVRKTNDKKILHKVGKQWKVVSVALLMAIGGGAAVAATNNTSANADANPYTMNAQTSAEVQSLEANPNVGQSSAPAKQSSKAASASTSAPTMPSLSLNPDPSLNGHNADAQYNRVKQGYDKAVIKYYGNKVNSYVNFVNAKYPSEASTVNSNYEAASSNQSNDRSLASSYAATASGKNWSAEVSNIAMQKSNIGASAYIETVGANVSANYSDVSDRAKALSGASAIASYATLISEINNNSVVSGEYFAKYLSASANQYIANNAYNTASLLASNFANDSMNNQTNYYSASASSVALSAQDKVAVANSGIDAQFVSSIASAYDGATSAEKYSNASKAVSAAAKAGDYDYGFAFGNDAKLTNLMNTLASANSAYSYLTSVASGQANYNSYSADVSSANSESALASSESSDIAPTSSAVSNAINSEAAKLTANSGFKASGTVSELVNEAISMAGVNSLAASVFTSRVASKASAMKFNMNASAAVSMNNKGTFKASVSGTSLDKINFNEDYVKNTVAALANNVVNAESTSAKNESSSATNLNSNISVSGSDYTKISNLSDLNGAIASASSAVNSAYNAVIADNDASDANRVLSDTATQQRYGSDKSIVDSTIASAKATSAQYSMDVSSANDALNVASANSASASTAVNDLAVLGNYPQIHMINNGGNITVSLGNGISSNYAYTQLVPSASASAFYSDTAYNVNSNLNSTFTNDASAEASAVNNVVSAANQAGKDYTSASNASLAYAKYYDADFVLASSYANSYEAMSGSDQSAFNSASDVRSNFYDTYAGNDYGSDADMLNSAESDEPNAAGLANGNATYVLKHEPHVVTVIKQLVMHRNPNYNDKTDTPADAKLAVINKGTHLMVTNVGFDKHGNTRLYVDYKGTKGFITGLRNYVTDSYLIPGQEYKVTFGRTANEYKGLQFNKANATKLSVKKNQTVTGTAVLNDDGEHFLGLTRLQLSNGNYVTTLDTFIKNATPLNENGQPASQKGAYFWNGQDTTFLNK